MPPYLKFVNTFLVIQTLLLNFLCGWKLSSHPTISENYYKKKTTSFKVYVAFFLPFFFSFYFLGDFGCTLVSSSTSFLYHLQFQFDGCWSQHTSRVVWLIIWVLISSVLHALLSHDKIAKYHVKIFKTNLNEFSL